MNFYNEYFEKVSRIYSSFIKIKLNQRLIQKFENKLNLTARKNKIFLFAGNGGSYADSLHFSSEITGKLINKNRPPYKSFVLGSNASSLTAISNDYSYADSFRREINPFKSDDFLLIILSTSGRSKNIIKLIQGKNINKKNTFIFTGNNYDKNLEKINIFSFDTKITSHIQECYKIFMHSCFIKNNF